MNIGEQYEKATQLREDILHMVYKSQSGHIGGSFSCLEILMALYYNVINVDSKNPHWEDRDRVILSKGHACPALYAILADLGFFSREDLWNLRQIDSHLQGHPDMNKTLGVDVNTGSLGQGVSVAGGMAMAAKYKKKNYQVFAIIGDGEVQEGLVWEAAMSAAHFHLDNLTVILDYNGLQLDGFNAEIMDISNIMEKYRAFGFECYEADGHNIEEIVKKVKKPHNGKPKFICCHTHKGYGVSFMEDNVDWHGKAPNKSQYVQAMKELGVDIHE
ncbi:transketolase [Iocasia frigidifontis]|uniref:Transketolase n=1 Tax=Iocasia fonsfrigidae TaxID=2682810 RepID=A0A8A7KNX5_9FIRM|nr:transketolase [Iocasia fonsfrigidae]QTL99754.1 transketolase [Iocasia fonsfrigidae]